MLPRRGRVRHNAATDGRISNSDGGSGTGLTRTA